MNKKSLKRSLADAYKAWMFQLSSQNNPFYIGFYRNFYQPKKGSIAAFLHYFSSNHPDTFVVQVGANDGFNHDPIHKFIKMHGWSGILIEPQRFVFQEYLQKLHAQSPKIKTLNAAMGPKPGEQSVYKLGFTQERWASGLTSFIREAIEDKVHDGTIDRIAQKHGITTPSNKADYIVEERIEVISPNCLKEKHGLQKLDVLMIDVEGYDFEIIKMMFESMLIPEVLVFEHAHLDAQTQEACYAYLKSFDFDFIKQKSNTLAVHKNSEFHRFFTQMSFYK